MKTISDVGPILAFSLAMCSAVSAQEQKFYWSGGKRIPITVMPDVVAVQANRAAASTPRGVFLPGVAAFADNADPRLSRFDREGVFFVKTQDARAADVRSALRASGRVQRLGMAATINIEAERPQHPVVVVTPEFIVRFKKEVPRERIDAINRERRVSIASEDAFVPNQFVLRAESGEPEHSLDLSASYYELPEVDRLAHPNFITHHATRAAPSDPLFPNQWHLLNTGQGGGKAGADVGAVGAWNITMGSEDITIAIIDPDGIQINHDDLKANKFVNGAEMPNDGNDDDMNGFIDDVSGWNFRDDNNNPSINQPHGTAVAGVAVASANNNRGGCGIAPNCKLLAILQGLTVQDDADAFRYAAKMGAKVISNSWGYSIGTPATQAVEDAIHDVVTQGCVVVFAMSNENIDNFGGPGGVQDISSHPDVLAIGRSTNFDAWGLSGFGKGMALLAPTQAAKGSHSAGCLPNSLAGSLDVTTTDLMGANGYNRGATPGVPLAKCFCNAAAVELADPNYTNCFGGTSAATPLVAGIAALMLSVNPNLTPDQVKEILIDTADKIDAAAANYMPDANGRLFSTTHGYGRVNAAKAVQLAKAKLQPTAKKNSTGTFPVALRLDCGELQDESLPGNVMIHGRSAKPYTIESNGKNTSVYVLENVRAIVGRPGAGRAAILESLHAEFKPIDEAWRRGLESRDTVVVEAPAHVWSEAAKRLADPMNRGVIRVIGRICFWDPKDPAGVALLTDEFYVKLAGNNPEEALRQLRSTNELELVRRDRFEKNTMLLRPTEKGTDPLQVMSMLKKIQGEGRIAPASIKPNWIVPVEKR